MWGGCNIARMSAALQKSAEAVPRPRKTSYEAVHRLARRCVLVTIGRQSDGCAYGLHPWAKEAVRSLRPNAQIIPQIFVAYRSPDEFLTVQAPMWMRVIRMLTGLTPSQLHKLGGVNLWDPRRDEVWKVEG